MKKIILPVLGAVLIMLSFTSCETLESAGTLASVIGEQGGYITSSQGESLRKSTAAVSKSLEEFTPEQEYYIGRSVGAVVLSKYPAYSNDHINDYVNKLGQTLAAASDKPEIFNGYHFLVLNSDDINAFATPGGHIFITRGLIRCCPSEDALAAILAHEIGHIQLRHGMQSIEKARTTQALTVLATEGAKTFGSADVAQLTDSFSGVITDIVNTMINNGYSRTFEYQADQASIKLLQRVGYNSEGLIDVLKLMDKNLKKGGSDFAKTHPAPQDRIKEIQNRGQKFTAVTAPAPRSQRFQAALAGI
jgi:beta-barrel assembly-enhancing protease